MRKLSKEIAIYVSIHSPSPCSEVKTGKFGFSKSTNIGSPKPSEPITTQLFFQSPFLDPSNDFPIELNL